VRFLLDENLSPYICPLITDAGHTAVHVRDLGMTSAPDRDVLARAALDHLVLITADRGDFGRELAASGATAPSMILLRQLPDVVRAEEVAGLLLANLTMEVTNALEAGAVLVMTPRSIRMRYLPIR
jgi:predicted nuclease of predicted toxin-antitoxin system